jgi:GNAT superfamily N-acetyltransferase
MDFGFTLLLNLSIEENMDDDNNLVVRNMTRAELDQAVEWAASEGWNPGLNDAEHFYRTDPKGFFIALVGGKPAGSISAVRYDDTFGFIGFYIVLPELRGHRIGVELGDRALEYLGDRNIGIDGVEKKIKNYEFRGFHFAYNNTRYEWPAGEPDSPAHSSVPLSAVPFEEIADYDSRFFPVRREAFLSSWINQQDGASLGIVEGPELKGYGVIRKCRKGHKIGPLFADNPAIADSLFISLTESVPEGEPVYLDVPAVNSSAMAFAEKYGMKPVFKTARMYNRRVPEIETAGIFGITTFELG